MPVLVDAYNLLHAARKFDEEGSVGRQQLCELVSHWARLTRQHVVMVFDGRSPPEPLGQQLHSSTIEVVYSGAGQSADQEIIARIEASTAPKRLKVVSTDRAIRRAARRRRCVISLSEDFFLAVIKRLSRQPRRQPEPTEKRQGLEPGEAQSWLELFDYDGDDAQQGHR